MMRHHALLAAAALATFALWPLTGTLDPAPAAAVRLALGLLLATAASAEVDAVALASGALGALGAAALAPASPALAGAALLGGAFAERSLRARSRLAGSLHLLLALGAGAAVFAVEHRFAAATAGLRATSLAVAVALATLPLLVPVDTPPVHLLLLAAARSREPLRPRLEEAASLCRLLGPRPPGPAERRAWSLLLRLVRQRVALGVATTHDEPASFRAAPASALGPEQAVARHLDEAIVAAIDALRAAHDAPAAGSPAA